MKHLDKQVYVFDFAMRVLQWLAICYFLCCIAINTRSISEHTRWSQGVFYDGWPKEDEAKQIYEKKGPMNAKPRETGR